MITHGMGPINNQNPMQQQQVRKTNLSPESNLNSSPCVSVDGQKAQPWQPWIGQSCQKIPLEHHLEADAGRRNVFLWITNLSPESNFNSSPCDLFQCQKAQPWQPWFGQDRWRPILMNRTKLPKHITRAPFGSRLGEAQLFFEWTFKLSRTSPVQHTVIFFTTSDLRRAKTHAN